MQITPHFSFQELTKTSTGKGNDPDIASGANLVKLAETLLEPIREMLGVPLLIHSAYRCAEFNVLCGGAANSAHLYGRAADFHPGMGFDIKAAFDAIRKSGLPFDKVILEHRAGSWWIHVQIAKAGTSPRHLAYVATIGPKGAVYNPVTD